ncbi:hypothetical protein BMR86_15705, partial [Stenotrophomonas sp. KAs 5-3]
GGPMRRTLILLATHLLTLGLGFGLGIYLLPILMAAPVRAAGAGQPRPGWRSGTGDGPWACGHPRREQRCHPRRVAGDAWLPRPGQRIGGHEAPTHRPPSIG